MTSNFLKLSGLLIGKLTRVTSLPAQHTDLVQRVSILKDELLTIGNSKEKFQSVLDQKGQWLFKSYRDGAGIVELMDQLFPRHYLALQVSFLLFLLKSSNLASALSFGLSLLDRFCGKVRGIIVRLSCF